MKLIFATNNQYKVDEIRATVGNDFEIITLKEAGIDIDIPEPFHTLEENATAKSKTIFELTGINCFSEDTGLEVFSLNGEPGVKSARYAGEEKSFNANIEKLLINLAGKTNREARFRTVISLIINGAEYMFEGVCNGHITTERKGGNGFGYDPVFIPQGKKTTFAEMSLDEKAALSHRAIATEKLVNFLDTFKINN
ncbi:MAG TPA: RdgB/HAM1 family non-canonical purine NTP pyrophosphatase [Chitinophagaceae bacterium]|nr:RdgB/HAM1 family non-canonical purine NTP pyrophosphatase [Chitinophagaceae bacterium]OPZ16119.1 MAG: Non-canonical purine NTP pyrophosphatase [Bacteroidetes bacterium ADurb.BinA245]HMW67653.1 RdgB/HAM1 family non-canonical purine NTP pyrophosphatase [Chitinophagaceae bacterium]HMX77580.1 RdgB/HAM1 family non-canonical purine NTP pyrophosphatase [Chitinophagaceae bacterium]HNA18727.1 RdgB/HAM1 family non-canonical purine NTP pyrophosphatase [Chitinophagaceae bacterium]